MERILWLDAALLRDLGASSSLLSGGNSERISCPAKQSSVAAPQKISSAKRLIMFEIKDEILLAQSHFVPASVFTSATDRKHPWPMESRALMAPITKQLKISNGNGIPGAFFLE